MKRSNKLVLGALTVWPVFFISLFVPLWIIFILFFFTASSPSTWMHVGLVTAWGLAALTLLLGFALLAYYIVHIFRNERLDKKSALGWLLGMWMGNFMAMPVYWFLHIWKEPPLEDETSPSE